MATVSKSGPPPPRDRDLVAAVEAETQRVGRSLWEHLERRSPSIFERRWWDDRILSWAMSDESVKVQMFRFVDVLPMLKTHKAVMRHLQEYFDEVRERLPWAARIGLDVSQPDSLIGRLVAINARSNARRMAQRFIAGSNVEEVLITVAKLRKQGFAFTLDLLGEAVISSKEADAYQQAYVELIRGLAPVVNGWPENMQIDRDQFGPIPRVNVSLKLSALYSQFKPIDPEGSAEGVKRRLRPLLRAARQCDAFVNVDMEHYAYKDLTLDIFKQVFLEDEFRDFPDCGIVVQAYLPDAGRDLEGLLAWARDRGTPVWVRLVKGAYWDYETVAAASHGWPVPVFQQKWHSDDNFERQTRFLMQHHDWLRPALGSHNMRSLAHGIAWARTLDIPKSAWEIQMLYGMGAEMAQLFTEMGHRVRIYTPFGELIPGMAYLVRRLLENTSNDSFLRQSFAENLSIEDLLMKPADRSSRPPAGSPESVQISRSVSSGRVVSAPEFTNEPHADFSRAEVRKAMQKAVNDVAAQFGGEYPLVINGRAVETSGSIASLNPSHSKQVVGTTASATPEHAIQAIDAARRTFPRWSREKPEYRAEYLELAAAEMRNRRYELAAWQVHECGKPWAEADGDVTEAIDFCTYYALQMRKLAVPRQVDLPGEENSYFYRPRGVAVVIAPWNFPLAILTGMTAAALVTGNTVVMKPAEQSPVMAAKLMEVFQNVGLPEGVLNYLPGIGEEVGPELVGSPDVDLIAFTGSRTVGLDINRIAADTDPRQRTVKRVIAEMGGKNAILIDTDADLDEAVAGTVDSAFGYAGQKCSACSRVIVLREVYEAFVDRLAGATESLKLGPAELPGTTVGPVISAEAFDRVREYIDVGREEAKLVLDRPAGELEGDGYYIGPHVFADVDPGARIAQEEIFGPVLSVIQARDLDHAIEIANGTPFALTAGLFSRSPANLRRARSELVAGNIYLNRGITGALVERQPFGGYQMSGIGTKAGGPDYLHEFLIPINVTENTLRRGFAPPPDEEQ
ncbi:MAG TPA: L-glutamate gamma-semialdehyde dehydrogenase [Planctomycetaceae bacterium]|nr:L-glutamate gamma-semialdehyde dehydrogenase [Planctomycetaceae bacterium]